MKNITIVVDTDTSKPLVSNQLLFAVVRYIYVFGKMITRLFVHQHNVVILIRFPNTYKTTDSDNSSSTKLILEQKWRQTMGVEPTKRISQHASSVLKTETGTSHATPAIS